MLSKNLNDKNDLSTRINSDLRRRGESSTEIDFGKDSDIIKDSKKTSRFGWIWFVLIILAIISLVVIAMI